MFLFEKVISIIATSFAESSQYVLYWREQVWKEILAYFPSKVYDQNVSAVDDVAVEFTNQSKYSR